MVELCPACPYGQAATDNNFTYTSINSYAEMMYAMFTHTVTRSAKASRDHWFSIRTGDFHQLVWQHTGVNICEFDFR